MEKPCCQSNLNSLCVFSAQTMKRAFVDTVDYSGFLPQEWHISAGCFDGRDCGWIDDAKHFKHHHLFPEQEIFVESIFDTHARHMQHWNSEESVEKRLSECEPWSEAERRRSSVAVETNHGVTAMEISEDCISLARSYESYSNMSAISLAEHNLSIDAETSAMDVTNDQTREIQISSERTSIKRYFPVLSHKQSSSRRNAECRSFTNSKLQQLVLNPATMTLSRAWDMMEGESGQIDRHLLTRCHMCMSPHQHDPESLKLCSSCYRQYCVDICGSSCYDCEQNCCFSCLSTIYDHGFDRQLCSYCKYSH